MFAAPLAAPMPAMQGAARPGGTLLAARKTTKPAQCSSRMQRSGWRCVRGALCHMPCPDLVARPHTESHGKDTRNNRVITVHCAVLLQIELSSQHRCRPCTMSEHGVTPSV